MNYGDTKIDANGQLRVWQTSSWRKAEWRECLWCGKKFAYNLTNWKPEGSNQGRFCSHRCSAMHNGKMQRLKTRLTFRCSICHKLVRRQAAEAKRLSTCGSSACVSKRRSQVVKERHRQDGHGQFGFRVK